MHIGLVSCGSYPKLIISFVLSGSYCRLRIHAYVACLLWQYPSIHIVYEIK